MIDFYKHWADVKDEKFDGLIITGAPIEQLAFEQVDYWKELRQIFDWSKKMYLDYLICVGERKPPYTIFITSPNTNSIKRGLVYTPTPSAIINLFYFMELMTKSKYQFHDIPRIDLYILKNFHN